MNKSKMLNLQLRHDGNSVIVEVIDPVTRTIVRPGSAVDLAQHIWEQADALRPVQAGQWESVLSSVRTTTRDEERASA